MIKSSLLDSVTAPSKIGHHPKSSTSVGQYLWASWEVKINLLILQALLLWKTHRAGPEDKDSITLGQGLMGFAPTKLPGRLMQGTVAWEGGVMPAPEQVQFVELPLH